MAHTLDTDIRKYFPREQFRDGQEKCIEFIINAFNSDKKIILIEAPTGSGKSIIGYTIANMVNRSYYVTITKQLQDQLLSDFPDMVELKGKNAYPCTYIDRNLADLKRHYTDNMILDKRIKHYNCAVGYCRNKDEKGVCGRCFTPDSGGTLETLPINMKYSACQYFDQVAKAKLASKVVMNFSSFLYQMNFTKRFEPRDLLILDETHNCESQLLNFISFTLDDKMLSKHGIFVPELDSAKNYVMWMDDSDIFTTINKAIGEANDDEDYNTVDELTRLLSKCRAFRDNIDSNPEWVCEYTDANSKRSVTMRPVFVHDFINNLLFAHADKILMMSATILDVDQFCKSLGINRNHVAAYRMKNRFPVENRPIYIKPVAKMTGGKANMSNWIGKLVDGVDELLEQYNDKRGIIHTHNFAIMNALLNDVSKRHRGRLLSQNNFQSKHEMLVEHSKRSNSVIVAPAMHEGVDLHDDLSRFQVICKVPYPNLFEDKQLARRVELDKNYYNMIVALKLVQSYGRSIRSDTDYADTYVLDESIVGFINRSRILPNWFLEAIIYDNKKT